MRSDFSLNKNGVMKLPAKQGGLYEKRPYQKKKLLDRVLFSDHHFPHWDEPR